MSIVHPSGDRHWTRTQPERVLRGPAAPGAKLTRGEIIAICAAARAGAQPSALARQHHVSRITIWRHVRRGVPRETP